MAKTVGQQLREFEMYIDHALGNHEGRLRNLERSGGSVEIATPKIGIVVPKPVASKPSKWKKSRRINLKEG